MIGADPHVVSLVAPHSMEAEQYRVLRHGIEEKHHESGLQVVAVTSAADHRWYETCGENV